MVQRCEDTDCAAGHQSVRMSLLVNYSQQFNASQLVSEIQKGLDVGLISGFVPSPDGTILSLSRGGKNILMDLKNS